MSRIRHLFWDFDGTLYDSYPQMLRSVMLALEETGIAGQFAAEEVLRLIKINVYHGIVVCAGRAGLDVKVLNACYRKYHAQEKNFLPYDGLKECLQRLHDAGFRHYLYTHRDASSVRQLQCDGLWPLFSDSVTQENGFPRKPEPDALNALMARNGLTPDICAMVGDRDVDIEAGRNAGMKGFLFDPEGFYAGCDADMHITRLMQLADHLID